MGYGKATAICPAQILLLATNNELAIDRLCSTPLFKTYLREVGLQCRVERWCAGAMCSQRKVGMDTYKGEGDGRGLGDGEALGLGEGL